MPPPRGLKWIGSRQGGAAAAEAASCVAAVHRAGPKTSPGRSRRALSAGADRRIGS